MRRFIAAGFGILVVTVCVAAAVRRGVSPPVLKTSVSAERPMGRLVIHEWGTFTGFAGSDGVHLPFNTIIGSDLPSFVANRQSHAARANPDLNMALAFIKGGGAAALQRMETPVMYFYSDAPGDIQVKVDFPGGLLTEFYPPVRDLGPRYGKAFGEFAALAPLPPEGSDAASKARSSASFLDWGQVRLIPHPTSDELKLIPAVTNKNHYEFARDTDSDLVQFTDVDGTKREEKFLFYRGLGDFSLPVTLLARGHDEFELRNADRSPIPTAFFIEVDSADRAMARLTRVDNVADNQKLTLSAGKITQGDLADAIRNSLVANGLYEKEARAMVETWKANWLAEPGTRVLYIVPRTVTDALLPLHVTPTPDEAVRILVGRIDILTPEQESRIRSMMLAAPAAGTLSADDARTLNDLGRFLRPTLQRVSKLAGDVDQKQAGRLEAALYRTGNTGR